MAAALAGARDIGAERIAEDAERAQARCARRTPSTARSASRRRTEHRGQADEVRQYASFEEPVASIPSHRFLAIRRGEAEGVLRAHVERRRRAASMPRVAARVERDAALAVGRRARRRRSTTRSSACSCPAVEIDVRVELKLRADSAADRRLRAEPARAAARGAARHASACSASIPGCAPAASARSSTRPASSSSTTTIYLVQGDAALERARADAARARARSTRRARSRSATAPHGRETEAFVREVLRRGGARRRACVVPVNEAGASVYSASDLAREEFPDLDLTVRGAICIARRLQDPLAELVKIDPKSIGVGQYQHDVYQPLLGKKLGRGRRELREQRRRRAQHRERAAARRASPASARRSPRSIVAHRDENGAVHEPRSELLEVPRPRAARRSSRRRASCASAAASTRSTPAPCTPSATRSSSAWRSDLGVPRRRR